MTYPSIIFGNLNYCPRLQELKPEMALMRKEREIRRIVAFLRLYEFIPRITCPHFIPTSASVSFQSELGLADENAVLEGCVHVGSERTGAIPAHHDGFDVTDVAAGKKRGPTANIPLDLIVRHALFHVQELVHGYDAFRFGRYGGAFIIGPTRAE
jgi:hypothetical protein